MLTYISLILLILILLFFFNWNVSENWALPAINIALVIGLSCTILAGLLNLILFYFEFELDSSLADLIAVAIIAYVSIWLFASISYKITIPKDFKKDYIAIMYGVPNAPKFGPIPFIYPKVIRIKIPKDGIYKTSYKFDQDFFYKKTIVYWNRKKVYNSKKGFNKTIHKGKYKRYRYTLMFLSNEVRDQTYIDNIFNNY